MKRRNFLLSTLAMSATALTAKNKLFTASGEKILVVYFSWSGNTREIATQIQTLTGGDLFAILPEKAYPQDYNATVKQAKKEIEDEYRPAIQGTVENIQDYDTIFVGTPNWWSTLAPPVATFLATHNLSGKKVVPFCTHGGGGKAQCFVDIAKLCPSATIPDGFTASGSRVSSAAANVKKWLHDIRIIE